MVNAGEEAEGVVLETLKDLIKENQAYTEEDLITESLNDQTFVLVRMLPPPTIIPVRKPF